MGLKKVFVDYLGKLSELQSVDVINPSNLGSGTANSTTYLRGDNTWVAILGSGGITRSILPISVNTTGAASASVDYVYLCTGTFTYTKPTAVGNTNRYTIKNAGTGVITIVFTLGQTGDDSTTITLNAGVALDFISNNTNWLII